MRTSLLLQSVALLRLDAAARAADASDLDAARQRVLERSRLRCEALGVTAAASDDGDVAITSDGCDVALARERLLTLARLAALDPHLSQAHLHAELQQALSFAAGVADAGYLDAALRLAQALAANAFAAAVSAAPGAAPAPNQEPQPSGPDSGSGGGDEGGSNPAAVAKRPRRLSHAAPTPQPHPHSAAEEGPRRARALHQGMVAWSEHWHPRVRRAAACALLTAHGATDPHATEDAAAALPCSPSAQYTSPPLVPLGPADASGAAEQEPQQRGEYWCGGVECVAEAYAAAVKLLADDRAALRRLALRLLALLAGRHPGARLPGARWAQLGAPLPLADDAAQRLAGGAGDPDVDVRRAALRLLAGLPSQAMALRVKLQLLSKKATVSVSVASSTSGGGGAGGGSSSALKGPDGGFAWRGGPGYRDLGLLHVSVGALVRGTEDEDAQVRAGVARALCALSWPEVLALRHAAAAAASTGGPTAAAAAVGGQQQVAAQCVELLCDLLQDEDEGVRAASLGSVAALARAALCASPEPWPAPAPPAHAGPAPAGAAGGQALPQVAVLGREQLLLVIDCVGDADGAVRGTACGTLRALCSGGKGGGSGGADGAGAAGGVVPWSGTVVHSLAFAVARAMQLSASAAQGGGAVEAGGARTGPASAELLALVREVAACAPGPAKAAATSIAKQQQQQRQQQQQQQAVAGQALVAREHLLVMQALVQGAAAASATAAPGGR